MSEIQSAEYVKRSQTEDCSSRFELPMSPTWQAPLSDRHGCVLKFDFSGSGARMLVHPLPPTSRWRPYVAVGPVFQMIALADSP